MPYVKPVTGMTSPVVWQWSLADLGIMRWDPRGHAIAAMFGDNFEHLAQDWRVAESVDRDV